MSSAFVLVQGVLCRPPEQRTSKAGKLFTVATIRAREDEGSAWWKVMAFSESAQAELMRLRAGDALSVQGGFKAELYRPEGGEPRVSLTVFADAVLPLRSPKPRSEPDAGRSAPKPRRELAYDDDLPI